MKRCPVCSRVYDDPSLNFCLDDGTKMVAISGDLGTESHPKRRASDIPTEVLPSDQVPKAAGEPTLPVSPRPTVRRFHADTPPATGNRRLLIAVLIAVLLMGGVGLGVILTRTSDGESRADSRAGTDNSTAGKISQTPVVLTPTPTPYATATPTPTPSPTATPQPTPDLSQARSQVMSVMNNWAESLRRQDVSGNLLLYADRLDSYYQRGSVGKEQVRTDRQAILSKFYSSTHVELDNISIEIDSSGTKAEVSYDNSYNWRGGSKYLVGKSHNAMTLSKVGSRWLITSERHLKTYSERSGN